MTQAVDKLTFPPIHRPLRPGLGAFIKLFRSSLRTLAFRRRADRLHQAALWFACEVVERRLCDDPRVARIRSEYRRRLACDLALLVFLESRVVCSRSSDEWRRADGTFDWSLVQAHVGNQIWLVFEDWSMWALASHESPVVCKLR